MPWHAILKAALDALILLFDFAIGTWWGRTGIRRKVERELEMYFDGLPQHMEPPHLPVVLKRILGW